MVMPDLQSIWYGRSPWQARWLGQALLIPLSWLFAVLAQLRRFLYRLGVLRTQHLPVPVIIVGNITVGGTGKTPLVIWLAQQLRAQGWHPGIISRGYGGNARSVIAVNAGSDVRMVGDEPVLLAQSLACPVWTGRNRPAAGRALLAAHPETDIIVSDDGLQHLALARDFEIAVIDAARGFGNGHLLPAGPLRESVSRLQQVNAIVVNRSAEAARELPQWSNRYDMHLTGNTFRNLKLREVQANAADFSGKTVHAVAGIGNPARFFAQLTAMGIHFIAHAYPDHHLYLREELNFPGILIMTEKDAVKCETFATENMWVCPISAQVAPDLMPHLLALLGDRHG